MKQRYSSWACAAAALLLTAGCRIATPQQPAYKQAARANVIANKRTLTESPTQEHAAPSIAPTP